MSNKLQGVITLFNERKTFFNNHPDTYQFMRDILGEELPEGTVIEISVTRPTEEDKTNMLIVEKEDKRFVDSISDILHN